MGEWLQRHHHQQEDQGQANQQNIQRNFVGRFLPFGTFHQCNHSIQGGFARVGSDTHQQPVRHQPGIAGDRRTITPGLTNHWRGLARNRCLVDGSYTFDDLPVTRDHLANVDADHIAFTQTAGIYHAVSAALILEPCLETFATGLKTIGAGLATTFGQCFCKVGEQYGEPQPDSDLHRYRGRHLRIRHQAQKSRQDGSQLDHQHDGGTLQLAWIKLDERLHQCRAPQRR